MTIQEITEKLNELSFQYESLKDMVQLVDDYSRHMTSQMWTMLGVFFAIFAIVLSCGVYFLIRNIVNDKVNKEIDKRLISLLKENPPVFYASGSSKPDDKNKIYLSSSINGIEQIRPDELLLFEVRTEKTLWNNLEGQLIPVLRINESGLVEIEVLGYHENNGRIHWKILWPRIEYEMRKK